MLHWVVNETELFDIVDRDDNVIKVWVREDELHINDDITRVATAYLHDKEGRFYIAQRSENKKVDPLKYEATAHWRVNSWETYEEAIKREAKEEVNLDNIIFKEVWDYYTSFDSNVWKRQHYKKLFVWEFDQEIKFDKTEIHAIKIFDNIDSFLDFYNNNPDLFSLAVWYDLEFIKKYFKK